MLDILFGSTLMNILITKFKSLGDVILLTPLISNLKNLYPNSKIDLLLQHDTQIILKNNPHISKIYLIKRSKKSKIKNFLFDLPVYLKIRKKKYDILISSDRGQRGSIIAKIINAKKRIGRKNIEDIDMNKNFNYFFSFHGDRHVIDLNLDPILILGKKIKSKALEIYPAKKDFDYVKKIIRDKEFIQIHPVSQCGYKSINNNLMAKIIDYCEIDLGIKTIITGSGEKDERKINEIISLTKSKPLNLCSKLSLMETSALNKLAKLLVVVDTAVMHISTANLTPVIAFFGPTAVNNWGPWDSRLFSNNYLRKGGIQKHGIHTVLSKNYACVPCSQSGCKNSGVSNCLQDIEFSEVRPIIDSYIYG